LIYCRFNVLGWNFHALKIFIIQERAGKFIIRSEPIESN
jgi:hypothetical protein